MWSVLAIYSEPEEGVFFDLTEEPETYDQLQPGERIIATLPLPLDGGTTSILGILLKLDELAREPHGQTMLMELVRLGYNYGRQPNALPTI